MTVGIAKIIHQKTKEDGRMPSFGISFFVVALLLSAIFGYIAQMNDATSKGYEIRALESRAARLRWQNEKLRAELSELRSMGHIEEQVKMLGLVQTERVEYLKPLSQEVAVVR